MNFNICIALYILEESLKQTKLSTKEKHEAEDIKLLSKKSLIYFFIYKILLFSSQLLNIKLNAIVIKKMFNKKEDSTSVSLLK